MDDRVAWGMHCFGHASHGRRRRRVEVVVVHRRPTIGIRLCHGMGCISTVHTRAVGWLMWMRIHIKLKENECVCVCLFVCISVHI